MFCCVMLWYSNAMRGMAMVLYNIVMYDIAMVLFSKALSRTVSFCLYPLFI